MSEQDPPGGLGDGRSAAPLDDIDHALLDVLADDARTSVRTLAEQLHISRTNAYNRIARLRRDGIITGFTATVDPQQAGLGTSAYILLTVEQPSWREITDALRAIPYVEHVALVAGEFDVLVLVRTPDHAALREVVLERIQATPSVRNTHTWLIFEETSGKHARWHTVAGGTIR